jgi:hypothetical protein
VTLPDGIKAGQIALVIGRPPVDEVSRQLAVDPGVAIVKRLARDFGLR